VDRIKTLKASKVSVGRGSKYFLVSAKKSFQSERGARRGIAN
jgi:hypothetical protein